MVAPELGLGPGSTWAQAHLGPGLSTSWGKGAGGRFHFVSVWGAEEGEENIDPVQQVTFSGV